jgi:hypothetical protein
MSEALHSSRFKYSLKVFILKGCDILSGLIDHFSSKKKTSEYVYIEKYYPTIDIIRELGKSRQLRMVRSDFSGLKDILSGEHLPIFITEDNDRPVLVKEVLEKFDIEKVASFSIDGIDISQQLYRVVLNRIAPLMASSFKLVDVIMDFFSKRQLSLMVTMSSIGVVNQLMISYCKKNNIPVYMIINGLLANSFLDEAKDGTWINSYGSSVKTNYFKGMDNVVCLGDPRMDAYAHFHIKRHTVPHQPTICIGASGFTSVDLNCYLAIEFEFLNDIMKACSVLQEKGRKMNLVIKVRSNGYRQQYKNFLNEYYPDMPVSLFDVTPLRELYEQTDFFISIYSQALFEASCLGIPVLYYKNDVQYFHPPFDGESELVTALSFKDLIEKIELFYARDPIYDRFMDKRVMEKYIGPLDGKNCERNCDFIYSLLSERKSSAVCH